MVPRRPISPPTRASSTCSRAATPLLLPGRASSGPAPKPPAATSPTGSSPPKAGGRKRRDAGRTNPGLRHLLAIDHPRRAELIDQRAEAGGPESLLEGHLHRAL